MPAALYDNPQMLALACVGAVLVGLAKGGLPAVGSLAVPVLALAMSPVTAAGLLLPVYVVSDWIGIWLYRHKFSAPNLKILIPAALGGVGLGWATASTLPDAAITLLIGLMGIGFCLNVWLGKKRDTLPRPPDVPSGLLWGTLAGFTSFVSHSGAPPFQIYVLPQRLEKLVFAGTSTILFAFINAAKLYPYWQLGQLGGGTIQSALLLIPMAVASTVAGYALTRIISEKAFFAFVQISLFAVSLKLTTDATRALVF
jgi:uncharacterized membrane protein YfcA